MVSFPDGEWATLTPEKYYVASPGGEKRISISKGLEVHSIDEVTDKYNRPDLVAARIAGKEAPSGQIIVAEPTTLETPPSDTPPEFKPLFPPILSIESITFSENVLDAEEMAKIEITLKNSGPGDATDVSIEIAGKLDGISYPKKTKVPLIKKNKGRRTVTISVSGKASLPTDRALLDIHVIEPHFKVKIKGKRLSFDTRKLRTPELILAKFAAMERQAANPNGRIDVNEIIDLKLAVQNIGEGEAKNVAVNVKNSQNGVMLMGIVYGEKVVGKHPVYETLGAGNYKTAVYRYFINSEFSDKKLEFRIQTSEDRGKYGFAETKRVGVNTELKEEGRIHRVKVDTDRPAGKVIIGDIPEFEVDIEKNLPKTTMKNKNGIAVIIGNRNYDKIDDVKYAINDATLVKRYARDVLGFRDGNIFFVKDAGKEDFELYFGSRNNHKGKLYNTVRPHKSDVFVFYSGHGAPGLKDKKGYFVPVKADPYYIEIQGYPRETFYRNLDKVRARSLTVVVDACFSGMTVFKDHSGTVELSKDGYFLKKGILLTSSGHDQASSWYHEKKHGMFTYFFLKAIHDRNADFNRDGALTFEEMHRFISDETEGAPYYARRLHGIEQTPTIQGPTKARCLSNINDRGSVKGR